MIFRRRRTRIEIEHTTVKVEAGRATSVVAPRPDVVTPPVPAAVESVPARVLPFPALELNKPNGGISAVRNDANTERPIKGSRP